MLGDVIRHQRFAYWRAVVVEHVESEMVSWSHQLSVAHECSQVDPAVVGSAAE